MKINVMKCKKALLEYWIVLSLLLFIIIVYSVINWLTPLWCDDLDYGAAGHTFGDIAHKEIHDYYHANGRICSHSLVQVFAGMLGKPLFNLLNPVMTLLMIILLPVVSGKTPKVSVNKWCWLFLVSISLMLVWFVMPDQYITMFMIAGSSNYIWAAVLNLLFVYMFTHVLPKEMTMKAWQCVGIVALSFFAGAWMEMYSIALAPALFLYLLLHRRNVNKRLILAFVFYVVGTAIVVFAPGNFVRQGGTIGAQVTIVTWLVNQLELAIRLKLVWVWLLTSALLIFEMVKKQYYFKEFVQDAIIWLVGIILSYAFLFVSGVLTFRALWAICLFSFVILFTVLSKVHINDWCGLVLSLLCVAIVCFDFCKEYKVCTNKRDAVATMLNQAQTGTLTNENYYLWPKTASSRKSFPVPKGLNGSWPVNSFATYYHLKKFVVLPEIVYSYCVGERRADSLYCGLVPMVEGLAITELEEGNSKLDLTYEFKTEDAYVFRSMFGRLIAAMGYDDVVRKVYDSNKTFYGLLLEKVCPLESTSSVSVESEDNYMFEGTADVFAFDFHQTRFLVAPVSLILPKYDAPIKKVSLEK